MLLLALSTLLVSSACNLVPVVDQPEPELQVHSPLDLAAIQRLRVGDSQGRVRAELGEPHHASVGAGGTITWRYWVFRPASQIAAQSAPVADEGIWAAVWAWTDRFLFVPSRQPPRQSRIVLPAEAHELVIVFSQQGVILASRFQSLKGPPGQ